MSLFKKDGHLSDEGLSLYVDALKLDKTQRLPKRVREHLDGCDDCKQTSTELYGIVGELDYSKKGAHPRLDQKAKEGGAKRRSLIFGLAIAASLALLAFFFYGQFKGEGPSAPSIANEDQPPQTPAVKNNPPIAPETPEKIVENKPKQNTAPSTTPAAPSTPSVTNQQPQQLAANMVPNEELDAMVATVYRSGDFYVMTPRVDIGIKKGLKVRFNWSGFQQIYLTIRVFNNEGEELHKGGSDDNYAEWDPTVPPGLYYWKLESPDDLLHVGRFRIVP